MAENSNSFGQDAASVTASATSSSQSEEEVYLSAGASMGNEASAGGEPAATTAFEEGELTDTCLSGEAADTTTQLGVDDNSADLEEEKTEATQLSAEAPAGAVTAEDAWCDDDEKTTGGPTGPYDGSSGLQEALTGERQSPEREQKNQLGTQLEEEFQTSKVQNHAVLDREEDVPQQLRLQQLEEEEEWQQEQQQQAEEQQQEEEGEADEQAFLLQQHQLGEEVMQREEHAEEPLQVEEGPSANQKVEQVDRQLESRFELKAQQDGAEGLAADEREADLFGEEEDDEDGTGLQDYAAWQRQIQGEKGPPFSSTAALLVENNISSSARYEELSEDFRSSTLFEPSESAAAAAECSGGAAAENRERDTEFEGARATAGEAAIAASSAVAPAAAGVGGEGEDFEEHEEEVELSGQNVPLLLQNAQILTMRLPPTVSVRMRSTPISATTTAAPTATAAGDGQYVIEWGPPAQEKDKLQRAGKHKEGGTAAAPTTSQQQQSEEQHMTSNCKLVEWEDGTYSLFIGEQPFDVQLKHDSTLFFEDSSHEKVKPFHCQAESRLQVRLGELLSFRRFLSKRKVFHGKKKTALTTQDQIDRADSITRKTIEKRLEAARMRRKQQESLRAERGLTRRFLEAESSEEEDATANNSTSTSGQRNTSNAACVPTAGGEIFSRSMRAEDPLLEDEGGDSLLQIKERYKRQRYK